MRGWWLLLLAALVAAGCQRRAVPPAAPPPTPAMRADALPLVGRFAGTLPCADCAGIDTELTLAADWDGHYLYHLKETFVGARDGGRTVETEGSWTTLRAGASQPDATVYQLNPDRPAEGRNFVVVDERTIRLLGPDLQPLPSTLPAYLTRVDAR